MSDLQMTPSPLFEGLDLSKPKLMVEPGSLIDCLNYETVDYLGYRRIDGFARYDGNVCYVDIPKLRAYNVFATTSGVVVTNPTLNEFVEDGDGNHIGFVFGVTNTGGGTATLRFVWFDGDAVHFSGNVGSWSFSAPPSTSEDEYYITQAQFIALDTALRGEVVPLPYTPVGLHWAWRNLFAIVPFVTVPYSVSLDNQPTTHEIKGDLTTDVGGGATATILGKVITTPAGASNPEEGFFILSPEITLASWEAPTPDTAELSGDVSVGGGAVIYHQPGSLSGMDSEYCGVWRAQRPATYNLSKAYAPPGWFPAQNSYVMRVTITGVMDAWAAIHQGGSAADSILYVDDGVTTTPVTVLDYYIVSGAFADGDAVIDLQILDPNINITTAFDLYSDSGATTKVADIDTQLALVTLPGFPQLNAVSSRYQFITSNFYATSGYEAIYGTNGAGRAFVIDTSGRVSLIYTQADEDLDKPRHVENHLMHLALGFQPGSVQFSVVGQPTNFDGALGAAEVGVGDTITGLMELEGTTLGVFCTKSIWSVEGSVSDAFETKVISPKSGCIEYTLANCGQPYYLDARGLSTLATTAAYGDFVGARLSAKISSWLRPRLRGGVVGSSSQAGVACAIPVRDKNQYRVFFNDGTILTATLRVDAPDPSFTWQRYYIDQSSVNDTLNRMIPFAWTSEVDLDGKERVFAAHYNQDSPVQSNQVFALECGNGFDGNYIPHYFTTNWYNKEPPIAYSTLQGIRLHGQSFGLAKLKVQSSGAQNDFFFNGVEFSETLTPINLPRTSPGILSTLHTTTNRADIAARGLGIQLKFSGSNTTLTELEPYHVAQVTLMYFTPAGASDL
jgi:hypothetical protein